MGSTDRRGPYEGSGEARGERYTQTDERRRRNLKGHNRESTAMPSTLLLPLQTRPHSSCRSVSSRSVETRPRSIGRAASIIEIIPTHKVQLGGSATRQGLLLSVTFRELQLGLAERPWQERRRFELMLVTIDTQTLSSTHNLPLSSQRRASRASRCGHAGGTATGHGFVNFAQRRASQGQASQFSVSQGSVISQRRKKSRGRGREEG